MSWWRRRTLRARLMIIGLAGLCVGLLLGGLVLVAVLGVVLQRSVDSELDRTAVDVAALVDAGALPQPVPVAGSAVVQVIDAQGRVRAASIDGDRLVPMLRPDELVRARAGAKLFIPGDRLGLDGEVRVLAVVAGPPNDPQTVLVGRSMTDALRGIHVLRATLLLVFPLLVLALAAVAWRVIGATLRPVETLRRGAEEITGAGQSGRLPVPAGEDEIHRLAVTLNGMLARLDSGRARQREFVADAAHELRSPLANMRAQLEVAQHLGPATDWNGLADDLLLDTARLSRLVDDLLLLARSDASPAPASGSMMDLSTVVSEVVERYPTVRLSQPDHPLWMLGESDAIGRVLANLLDNAVRHARSDVAVATYSDGTSHVVTVTDDGPGIPAPDRDRVFERFTRLDDGRARDAGGSGLGLAIVRELVRRHGGTVSLMDAEPVAGAEPFVDGEHSVDGKPFVGGGHVVDGKPFVGGGHVVDGGHVLGAQPSPAGGAVAARSADRGAAVGSAGRRLPDAAPVGVAAGVASRGAPNRRLAGVADSASGVGGGAAGVVNGVAGYGRGLRVEVRLPASTVTP